MKVVRKMFGLLALAVVLAPSPTHAVLTTSHIATDAEMLAILTNLVAVAEGRIGDRGGAATFELDLGQDTGAPFVTANDNWVSGQVEPFSLGFNHITNVLTFQLGGHTLQYSPGPNMEEFFIRTRSTKDGATVLIDNLVLDGEVLGDQSQAVGPDALDILRIHGADFTDGFLLTGDATLSWGATLPNNSHLAFQIKVGSEDNPTPAATSTWGRMKELYR